MVTCKDLSATPKFSQCYHTVFKQAAVGIAVIGLDGQFLEVNTKLCEILGYSYDELVQFNFQSLAYSDDPNTNLTYVNQLLSKELTTYNIDKPYIRKDGSLIWIRLAVSLTYLPTGLPEHFIAVIQDIQEYKRMEQALINQERRAKAVLDASIDGFWVVAATDGILLEVNDVYCRLSGYNREELLTMRVSDIDCQETPEDAAAHIERVMQQGGDVFKTKHRRKNGEIWRVEVTVTYSDIEGGRLFVFVRDIRERHIKKALLKLRLRLSNLVHDGSTHKLSQTPIDLAETLTNSRIGFLHLVTADQKTVSLQVWSTNTIKTFCSAHGSTQHYPITEAGVWVDCIHKRGPVIHNDYATLPHKKGLPEGHPQVIRELTVPVFRNGAVVAVLGVGNKATAYADDDIYIVQQIGDLAFEYLERKWVDERIEFMAYYDALTKLPNRTLLLDRLNQSMVQTHHTDTMLALAYLDLDGFKPVNDQYGHAVGDEFLAAFAHRMTRFLRGGDTMARLGGDEFALILPGLSHIQDGEIILWRLLEILAEPFFIAGHEIQVGASIGFTIYPLDESNANTLLRHADQAMYQAKWRGKNTVCLYDTAQNMRLQIQRETIDELRQAFTNNELALYYQPIVNLVTGEVAGLEANICWHHPQRGSVRADEFIPALHGTPKATRLDKWLIHQVLSQIAIWESTGKALPVTVSISYNSLDKRDFITFINDQTAYWPSAILAKLEICIPKLSSAIDIGTLRQVITSCNQLGINFTADIYNSTQATLEQLISLPIGSIKLDRQYVHGVSQSLDNLSSIEHTIKLANNFSLKIVAQGVDNLILAALLIDLGCQQAQGSSIAQPMSAELISQWRQFWTINPLYKELCYLKEGGQNALLRVAIRAVQRLSDEITNFVNSSGHTECPVLCTDSCQISWWYKSLGLFRYGKRPGFAFQAARHRNLHLLAANLAELTKNGLHSQARANLIPFYEQCNEFINMIIRLGNED